MAPVVQNVYLCKKDRSSSISVLVDWLSLESGENAKNLKELRTGIAYCKLINKLYPNHLPMSKVAYEYRLESFESNMKLLHKCFQDLKIEQDVMVLRLSKGYEHLEFLRWMKKFYTVNRPLNAN